MKGKIIMNNNTNNNVQMPESLVIMQAQNSLKQLLQVFPLSIPVWRLIIKDLMHDLNDSYMAQLTNDQDEYQRRISELNNSNEATPQKNNKTTKE